MQIRRVVTGHDAAGRSVVVSDEAVDGTRVALTAGTESHIMWGADAAPSFPDDGTQPSFHRYFPPVGGFRFGFFSIPPADTPPPPPPADIQAALVEFEATFPGMAGYMEPGGHGFHTTDTVDCLIVMEGEVELLLDDGATVRLQAGDTLVQNGTRHSWRNPGSTTARVASFISGAHHEKYPQA